jgi:hypothetical protein
MKVIRVVGFADGSASEYDDQWLEKFDPDYDGGLGRIWTTSDPARAMLFDNVPAAMDFWKTQSKVKPLRADGKPNRPLTALTIGVEDPDYKELKVADVETITQFCICSEEQCFCANTIEMKLEDAASNVEWECLECKGGHHVWSPDGPRE